MYSNRELPGITLSASVAFSDFGYTTEMECWAKGDQACKFVAVPE